MIAITFGVFSLCVDFKNHAAQITQYPGERFLYARRADTGNGSRIDQQRLLPFNIWLPDNFCDMTVPAANQIVVSGTGQRPSVMRIVRGEDTFSCPFKFRILPVVEHLTIVLGHHPVQRHLVADIIAVNHMQRDTEFERGAQGIRTDQVTAMYDGLGTQRLRFGDCRSQRLGTIMTVRDDAYFHLFRSPHGIHHLQPSGFT
jgi:hypothetical protein